MRQVGWEWSGLPVREDQHVQHEVQQLPADDRILNEAEPGLLLGHTRGYLQMLQGDYQEQQETADDTRRCD